MGIFKNMSGKRGKGKNIFSGLSLQKMVIVLGLFALIMFFSLTTTTFLSVSNINNILLATMINGVLACGELYVIITGGIDCSCGTIMSLIGMLVGTILAVWGFPIWVGIILAILLGALLGSINGFMVTRMGIQAFIATLGMMWITYGLSVIITNGSPIYFTNVPGYQEIALNSFLKPLFEKIGIPNMAIRNGVIYMFIIVAVLGIILSKTKYGRYTYALGNNLDAARYSGIRVERYQMGAYIMSGAMSGVAAILMTSRLKSANPITGKGYEMNAIAACVIGGASLAGGKGSIFGALLGALIMSVLSNGLRLLSVSTEWQNVLTGAIIIGAVYMDHLSKNKKAST